MTKTLALAVLLIAVSVGASVAGGTEDDPDLPALDPPGRWRVVTGHDATSTSKCIGRPVTPLCAVESFAACFARNVAHFCRVSSREYEKVARDTIRDDFGTEVKYTHYYRVVSARRLTEADMRPWFRTAPKHCEDRRNCVPERFWEPGDVRIITEQKVCQIPRTARTCERQSPYCWPNEKGELCERWSTQLVDIVKRGPSGWQIVDRWRRGYRDYPD